MVWDVLAAYPHVQLAQVTGRADFVEQIGLGCDLVLTDVWLLGFDGAAAVDYVARHWPQLPVIVCTAAGSERVAAQAVRSGAFDYLTLPLDLGRLDSAIQQALQRSAQRREQLRSNSEMYRQSAALERRLTDCEAQLNVARRELSGLAETASELLKPSLAAITEATQALHSGVPTNGAALRHLQDIADQVKRMHGVIDGLAKAARG